MRRLQGWIGFADVFDKASLEETQLDRLLDCTGVRRQMEAKVKCRSSMPERTSSFGVLPVSQVGLCETEGPMSEVNVSEDWCDVEFEVALDSGSQDHVCDEADTPGYALVASLGSDRGACFVVGKGGRIPNLGQKLLNLEPDDDESSMLKSCFQIA